MNDTPTPRSDKAKIAFTSLFANDDAYWIPYVVGKNLERELTAVTEQRDGLQSGIEYASDQLHKVTEQRDRLAKACDQYSEDEILCKLQEITAQRDRMAEALRRVIKWMDEGGYYDISPYHQATESLQSLTPKDK